MVIVLWYSICRWLVAGDHRPHTVVETTTSSSSTSFERVSRAFRSLGAMDTQIPNSLARVGIGPVGDSDWLWDRIPRRRDDRRSTSSIPSTHIRRGRQLRPRVHIGYKARWLLEAVGPIV